MQYFALQGRIQQVLELQLLCGVGCGAAAEGLTGCCLCLLGSMVCGLELVLALRSYTHS